MSSQYHHIYRKLAYSKHAAHISVLHTRTTGWEKNYKNKEVTVKEKLKEAKKMNIFPEISGINLLIKALPVVTLRSSSNR
jgi:hypothetical protein